MMGMTAMSWKSRTANAPFPARWHQAPLAECLEDDGGAGQREDEADGERGLPAEAGKHGDPGDGCRGGNDLESAEAKDFFPHAPEDGRLELKADEEQHHHHAEFREVHDILALAADEFQTPGADHHADGEIAEHRAERQAFPQENRDECRREVDEGVQEQALDIHGASEGIPVESCPYPERQARSMGGLVIFESDGDRKSFLLRLAQVCGSHGWRDHALALMGNHSHLLLETPEPNLVTGMKFDRK